MSIGHRFAQDELDAASVYELYSALGDHDTPALFQRPYRLDTDHDISTGGGNSVDRGTVYIDRTLYQEVMAGRYAATGLEPQQIITLWCDHEHGEKCVADGENPVDIYQPCHKRALRLEHIGALIVLGRDRGPEKIRNYEAVIWPGLMECYHRPIRRSPKDLWAGPLLDDPTERDLEILAELELAGVSDATKHSKKPVHYGIAEHCCVDCRFWSPDVGAQQHRELAMCKLVSGLVRDTRGCELWKPGER